MHDAGQINAGGEHVMRRADAGGVGAKSQLGLLDSLCLHVLPDAPQEPACSSQACR
jgi:hypothetical protein